MSPDNHSSSHHAHAACTSAGHVMLSFAPARRPVWLGRNDQRHDCLALLNMPRSQRAYAPSACQVLHLPTVLQALSMDVWKPQPSHTNINNHASSLCLITPFTGVLGTAVQQQQNITSHQTVTPTGTIGRVLGQGQLVRPQFQRPCNPLSPAGGDM